MKRILTTILLCLYLAASTGATLHVHSCMGKLVSWQLWHGAVDAPCSHCGMQHANGMLIGCCADTHAPMKLPQDQHGAEGHVDLQPAILSLPFVVNAERHFFAVPVSLRPTISTTLLLSGTTPLFVRHCTFLI